MANAEVGDDVYGDDPIVKALERATADLREKEDAVYMPPGTVTDQVGIRSHTEPGDAVPFDQNTHVFGNCTGSNRSRNTGRSVITGTP